ncbi:MULTISPECIES: major capsid protein [unclassified Sphingomonas]|uniref:major capsid protein n=1 Tax=Novosphingobium rhizosphaerae TaxID=1551649 RepID=UPI0015CC8399
MAILGTSYWNLIDVLKASNDSTGDVVEALTQLTPFMKDANVITCNSGTEHRSSIRTGLPSVSWGALYQGIAQSKGNYSEVKDTTGFVEGLSSVDERLLNLKPKEAAKLRLVEGQGFLESIAQTVESAIWYSDVKVNGKQFHGLAPRYNSLSNANVVNGGGSGSDNTSIWMVTHGDMQTSIITPENVPASVQREDMGRQRVLDASGNPYYVKEEKFSQHIGLCVKDWRFNGRLANIDVSDVIAGTVAVNPLLRKLYYRLQGRRAYKMEREGQVSPGRTVIYMNKTMLEALDAESTNGRSGVDNFVRLTPMEIQGEEVMTWRGMPIRETDALLNTETLVQ